MLLIALRRKVPQSMFWRAVLPEGQMIMPDQSAIVVQWAAGLFVWTTLALTSGLTQAA